MVCKMLCELASKEGLANMAELKYIGKPMDKLTSEFIRKMPEVGMFECTYSCDPDKENRECRVSLGVKYLDWTVVE